MFIVDTFVVLVTILGIAGFMYDRAHKHGPWERMADFQVSVREIAIPEIDRTLPVRSAAPTYLDALLVEDALHEWRVRLAVRGAFRADNTHGDCAKRHRNVVQALV